MSKSKTSAESAASKASLAVAGGAVDPVLASLFASSAGPVQIAERKARAIAPVSSTKTKRVSEDEIESSDAAPELSESSETDDAVDEKSQPPRKRRKVKNDDELEAQYLMRLVQEEEKEAKANEKQKRKATKEANKVLVGNGVAVDDDAASDTSASNDLKDLSDLEDDDVADNIPLHESLTGADPRTDQNKRTIFISNVATSAIKSKSDRKTLVSHLKSALLAKEKESIVSIRFRSTAFDVSAGPKRAAYAKKELMDETTRSTNAYVVLSSEAAARRVAAKLNGSEVLGRHIHIDSLANPMRTDNKRCVFVGNLPFVDEEMTAQDSEEDQDGTKKPKRQKAKLPADAEEGLWRTFLKCGKVESVRVVRDRTTRVGKGFAYVQFEDGNGVEKALLLDGKKFPPLLPRLLRVSRAKGMKRKEVRAKEDQRGKQVQKGRRRDGAKFGPPANRKPKLGSDVVFEGYRASSDNKMKFKTKGKSKATKNGIKPTSRSSRRGSAFKAGGGKKKRDA